MPNDTSFLVTVLPDSQVKILLAQDYSAGRSALRALLDDLGYSFVEARTHAQALECLCEQDFAVVLLDVRLLGANALEAARQLRGQERCRHTAIIFLAPATNPGLLAQDAYSLGPVDYLIEPVVPVILRAKVAGFVHLYRKTEQVKQQWERLRDVERQEFERKLADENARFRALTEHSADAVLLLSRAGTVLYITPSCRNIVGHEPEERVGRSGLELVHPEDLPRVQGRLAELLAAPLGTTLSVETRLHHKDGSWRSVEIVGTNLLEEPAVQALVVNYRDISERKSLVKDLQDRVEQLAETDRRKDEFLAMLAHELRNPLAPIANAVQILRLVDQDDCRRPEAWDMIDRQVQHLTRLVGDLLDVSRITRGKITLQRERLDLAAILTRAIEASQPMIDARNHKLFVTLPSQPVRIEGDPVRLAQAFANLLNNAAKYTLDGGRLQLSVEHPRDEALVRVRDSGVGIAAELLPKIFDLFTQGDRSLARSEGGLGIGLTMVKSLVEMHGGRVEAHSEGLGKGSEFVVRLPVLTGKSSTMPKAAGGASALAELPAHRVLIVDDNQDAAQSLATLLRIRGQEVHVAFDGPSALQAAETFGPDVTFLDIGLPGMDGYEVAQRLRNQPRLHNMLLVALTGYGQQDDRRRSREAGFDVHLVKPADPATLQTLLAEKKI